MLHRNTSHNFRARRAFGQRLTHLFPESVRCFSRLPSAFLTPSRHVDEAREWIRERYARIDQQEQFAVLRKLKFFHEFSHAEIWEVLRASQWQDEAVQPHWRVNAHLLRRQEEGQVVSHNGRADYRGQVWGSLVELGYRLRPDWQLALRHERLAMDHELHGANVQLIAQDAGLLDNTHSPQRLGAKLSWQVRPGWTLHGSVLRDHSRAEAQWLSTLGLTWRPEGWRVK